MNILERVDGATHVPDNRLVEKPSFPKSVKIEITSRCNFKCSYCATNRSKRPMGEMDLEVYRNLVKNLVSVGVEEFGLFLLGESFILKNLDEYIKIAKDGGAKYVFITTNGSLCTPERMIKIVESGLDSIKFSVNAGEKERYKEIHGVDAFETVVQNIKWLHSYLSDNKIDSLKTSVSSIFVPEFKDELESFREMISKYVDHFYYLPMYSQGGNVGSVHGSTGNPGRLDNMVDVVPCWMLFNASRVTWDGKLTACCFDHEAKFIMGDLKEDSVMDAWHSEKFIELRKRHLENNLNDSLCAKCLGLVKE